MNPGRMAYIAYFRRVLLFATVLHLTGGINSDRRVNIHRQHVFFAQLFSPRKKRVLPAKHMIPV